MAERSVLDRSLCSIAIVDVSALIIDQFFFGLGFFNRLNVLILSRVTIDNDFRVLAHFRDSISVRLFKS